MEGLEGKRLTVFYDDGKAISRKDGLCTIDNGDDIVLDNRIVIPRSRIIRMEIGGGF